MRFWGLGLYYFNARWYDAELGRFTTEDPIRDGLHWYAYVSGNPMMFVDPTGLWSLNIDGTYTAEKDDTLWGLAEDLTGDGTKWEYYEIAGDPTAEIDPTKMQIGTTINVDNIVGFMDMDSAAENITNKINPESIVQDREFGGLLVEESGRYHYTRPVMGQRHSMPESTFPAMQSDGQNYFLGTNPNDLSRKITAIYHTHGASQSPTDEFFSGQMTDKTRTISNAALGWQYGDKFISDTFNVWNYVGTPGGKLRRYIPSGTPLGGSDMIIGNVKIR